MKKEKYPVKVWEDKTVHIYHKEPICKVNEIEELERLGISYGRIDFLDETKPEIEAIMKKFGITKKCQDLT